MVLVKVAYDAYNQQFRLVDSNISRMFQDGEVYLLAADSFLNDNQDDEIAAFQPAEIGHA